MENGTVVAEVLLDAIEKKMLAGEVTTMATQADVPWSSLFHLDLNLACGLGSSVCEKRFTLETVVFTGLPRCPEPAKTSPPKPTARALPPRALTVGHHSQVGLRLPHDTSQRKTFVGV